MSELRLSLAAIFGRRLALAEGFAAHLTTTGVEHGLVGPREVDRVWDRHIVNCALLDEVLPHRGDVIDVGSGAGLPGLVTSILRPEQHHHLVEPMERRTTWLQMVVDDLSLDNVSVVRARAEDVRRTLSADIVTARAVAPLDRLARWALPLVAPGGHLYAIKGRSAQAEVERTQTQVRRAGGADIDVIAVGADSGWEPTTVVRIHKPSS